MLQLTHLYKSFGNKTVATDINLDIAAGKLLAVLGQSGCGKSTLLKMIAGLETPDSGKISLNGTDITAMPSEKRNIALMFQDYALFPHLNVIDNAAFGLKMRGVTKAEAKQRAMQLLTEVGLAHEADRRVEKLSGGEQQRLALARALVTRPDALLLDEAFSSLDSHLRQQLRELATSQIHKYAIPTILVTHSPEEALGIADSIAVMHNGQILQYGTPHQLLHHPSSRETALLLGLPNVNEQIYIPQNAISLTTDAPLCPVISVTELPESICVCCRHPQYGAIHVYCTAEIITKMELSNGIPIHIHQERIIRFSKTLDIQ
ncbi:ABC transporter ATP-binding protein [Neisseria perflava]|uniref:ABC transporter ATP-binding protein n=1 Tax=Neisseria perflava TaxID=33053 RepID=UPI0020A12BEE|nr:ABC transporter ATP-binding protein [Neisseria perflava]MCP1659995.1 ABC-type Fe3+/spermidine/putrescine transport system ATPase subunit [Neisseria perflava]MCP1771988.1 ABC-type Fe3+/spermidine/putrescine transport system ATPase subunit [Neisseria perflava]